MKRLCESPAIRISMRAAGPMARYRARVGGSFQAKMSKPGQVERVRDGLTWQRAAEDDQVAQRPRREDRGRDDGDDADEPQTLDRLGRSAENQAMAAQIRASQTASLRVNAARPRAGPRASRRGSVSLAPRGSRTIRVMRQARAEHERGERHRRVGQGRAEQQRQVDGAWSGRSRCASPASAFRLSPRSTATSARQPPGQDRHEAPRRARSRSARPGR